MRREKCRGFSLLEVLVALALLGVAGTAVTSLLGAAQQVLARSAEHERQVVAASALLEEIAGGPRLELEGRVGRRFERGLQLRISRVDSDVFSVDVADTDGRPLLATMLYRPAMGRDAR